MNSYKTLRWMALSALLLLAACNENSNTTPEISEQIQDQPGEREPEEGQPPAGLEAAASVMTALKEGDMSQLAAWAHREKGIRFSPYAYVDTKKDLVFKKEELEGLMKDSKKWHWGDFAGSGEGIELPYSEYHKRFIYDADFIGTAEIAVNKVLGEGTTINNLNEVYPKESHDFIEYYVDGIDPDAEGMDWRSLRLVFEKIGNDHALVGIIHDQWTP